MEKTSQKAMLKFLERLQELQKKVLLSGAYEKEIEIIVKRYEPDGLNPHGNYVIMVTLNTKDTIFKDEHTGHNLPFGSLYDFYSEEENERNVMAPLEKYVKELTK